MFTKKIYVTWKENGKQQRREYKRPNMALKQVWNLVDAKTLIARDVWRHRFKTGIATSCKSGRIVSLGTPPFKPFDRKSGINVFCGHLSKGAQLGVSELDWFGHHILAGKYEGEHWLVVWAWENLVMHGLFDETRYDCDDTAYSVIFIRNWMDDPVAALDCYALVMWESTQGFLMSSQLSMPDYEMFLESIAEDEE